MKLGTIMAASALLTLPALADDYPGVILSNDSVTLGVHLPDRERGAYRATRFDHAGLIHSVRYQGLEYFGPWRNAEDDPNSHEFVNGPADTFNVMGYGESDSFVRLGVGVLNKPAGETEFRWDHTYEIADFGQWHHLQSEDAISFEQVLNGPDGWAWTYRKTVRLLEDGFRLEYELNNRGQQAIDLSPESYNHNFYVFGDHSVDDQYRVEIPYPIQLSAERWGQPQELDPRVHLSNGPDGGRVTLSGAIDGDTAIYQIFEGSESVSDHQITVRHISKETGEERGIHLSMDLPMKQLVVWTNGTALSPENFISLVVPAGERRQWQAQYRLF
ncbi:hypothetical protein [Ferrimonas pelagia]|uniref:Aldose 1-epimerase n=1 Tax=Ferrimonas pelagia TaxID=1177826 RepID=A0ABP9FD70_9GAMM